MAAVAEAARNLSCVGAEPLAVTDNLNFPSPQTPTGYWQLAMACRGLAEACRALETPVTGGNVSLFNESRLPDGSLQPIHPTPVVGMVGLVGDLARVTGLAWRQDGDAIWLLGVSPEAADAPADPRVSLAAGSYLECIHGRLTGRPPAVDLHLERAGQAFLRGAIAAGLVVSAHDLSDGGLAVAAAECCLAGGLGARLVLPAGSARPDRLLFAEGGARMLVSVSPTRAGDWRQALERAGSAVSALELGVVEAGGTLRILRGEAVLLQVPVADLRHSYDEGIPRRLREAGPPPEH
jgi:phosphoribosylformylglycinamidine synthase